MDRKVTTCLVAGLLAAMAPVSGGSQARALVITHVDVVCR
jgi:hypothetical protein